MKTTLARLSDGKTNSDPGQAFDKNNKSAEGFPSVRMRRLRRTEALRRLVQENAVTTDDLILPLFVEENLDEREAIQSLPGVFRETEKSLEQAVTGASGLGINAVMLFGVSHEKDAVGSDSLKADGLLGRMIRRAKDAAPDTAVIADVCFCEYTDHGHCGPLDQNGDVDNDRTLENLQRQALVAVEAGADVIAPSGMMDGMVSAIRQALDENGHEHIPVLSYAAKFASAFYGPFRDAAGCALGSDKSARSDRKTYQMNPANADEAMREIILDIQEGADMIMIKPGLPYLDIIRQAKDRFRIPTFAYHVSGEYAMLKAASEKGMLDYDAAYAEALLSFKRAGADAIISYGACDFAKSLQKQ